MNPEGSGRSFFVACPVPFGDEFLNDTELLGDDISLNLTVGTTTSNVDVTCTGYWYGPTALLNSVTQTFTLAPGGTGDFELPDVVDPNITQLDGSQQSLAVVCALPPQTGVRRLTLDSD